MFGKKRKPELDEDELEFPEPEEENEDEYEEEGEPLRRPKVKVSKPTRKLKGEKYEVYYQPERIILVDNEDSKNNTILAENRHLEKHFPHYALHAKELSNQDKLLKSID